jgi:hypothetical protein
MEDYRAFGDAMPERIVEGVSTMKNDLTLNAVDIVQNKGPQP